MNNKYCDDHSYLTEYKDRSTINKPLSSNDTIPRELDATSESVHVTCGGYLFIGRIHAKISARVLDKNIILLKRVIIH